MIGELFVGELLVNQFLQTFMPTFNLFFQTITFFGHPALWLLIAAWLFWLGKEKKSFTLVSIVLFSSLISGALKFIIARPRPEGLIVLEKTPTQLSMPSGHSVLAGTIYSFFEKKVYPKERILLFILMMLTAISRLYLGVHYISDVFAGLLIGYFIGKLMLVLEKKIKKSSLKITKFKEEKELFILFIVSIASLVLLPETFALGYSVLGYYFGFVIYRHNKMKIKNSCNQLILGTLILAILAYFAFTLEGYYSFILFFVAGMFITIIWPTAFNKGWRKEFDIC